MESSASSTGPIFDEVSNEAPPPCFLIEMMLHEVDIVAMLDLESNFSYISEKIAEELSEPGLELPERSENCDDGPVQAQVTTRLSLGQTTVEQEFHIVRGLPYDCILGADFRNSCDLDINFDEGTYRVGLEGEWYEFLKYDSESSIENDASSSEASETESETENHLTIEPESTTDHQGIEEPQELLMSNEAYLQDTDSSEDDYGSSVPSSDGLPNHHEHHQTNGTSQESQEKSGSLSPDPIQIELVREQAELWRHGLLADLMQIRIEDDSEAPSSLKQPNMTEQGKWRKYSEYCEKCEKDCWWSKFLKKK